METVVAESFHTIIISAYKDRAIKAFEYGVLDFIPKPFDEERLSKACQRITPQASREVQVKYLAIKKRGKQALIKTGNILYIKGAGIYTEVYLHDGTRKIHNKSLESLTTLLPDSFERIHKSYLVEMNNACQIIIEPGSKYSLEINSERLPIDRTRYKKLQERWFS